MVIDAHAHIVPEAFVEDVRAGRFGDALSIEQGEKWELLVIKSTAAGSARVFKNALPRETFDLSMRLQHMDEMGVERQILSIVPPAMAYGLDTGVTKEIAAAFNDRVGEIVAGEPQRFSSIATVPLQDPPAAADELERAIKQGHVGVQIGSNVAGENLDAPELNVFWEKAQQLDIPVFIHPLNQIGGGNRLKKYELGNLLGVPFEGAIAAASLIFGGVMERFQSLMIIISHMGGATPWLRGRMEHGYHAREGARVNDVQPPESYLGRFYYDTIVHNAECLEFAAKTLGTDIILYGTDYPFDMGDLGPAKDMPGLSRLSDEDQKKILSENSKNLFKL
jgi:aminocarboxymuconate-semialdehyde decarboxylase